MKILLVYQYFLGENESGHTRWNEMVKLWAASGHEITVITGMVNYASGLKQEKYKNKYFVNENYTKNVDVIRCHVSESYNKSFRGRLWGYFSFTFSGSWAVLTRLHKKKYDMVLVSSPPLFVGIIGYIASKFKQIPMVFEVRDLWPESAIDTGIITNKTIIRFAYWVEKFLYKNSSLINVLTPAFEEALLNKKGILREKLIMIPNAADFTMAEALNDFDIVGFRKQLGWEDKFVVLYVGAHGIANNLIQLVNTAEILKDTKVHFVLIGNGMEKESLKIETQKRNLHNVMFLAPVPKSEVFKFILACDAGTSVLKKNDVFKTVYSSKTFDYMACKKPILMAIDGVSKELVEEAKAGLYVEPENPNDFANQIKTYINNPSLPVNQGINGYNYAKKYFDRKVLANNYLRHLNEMLNKLV